MRRIGITQRLDQVPGRDEYRDALDARWANLLWPLGYLPVLLSSGISDIEAYLEALELEGLLLSGGNDLGEAQNRDRLEEHLLDFARKKSLPVLGVCRGMQMMNCYLDGQLQRVEGHVATRHELQGSWAENYGFQKVNSFHNEAILPEGLGDDLEILASSDDGVIEAFKHSKWPWLGIMWHPEREIPYSAQDLRLIKETFGE